jgi:hypothetical protein
VKRPGKKRPLYGGKLDKDSVIEVISATDFNWSFFTASVKSLTNAIYLAPYEVTEEVAKADPEMKIQLRPSNVGYELKYLPRRCPQCSPRPDSVFQPGNVRQKFCWRCTQGGDMPDARGGDQELLREVKRMVRWLRDHGEELGSRLTDAPDIEQPFELLGFGRVHLTPRVRTCAEFIGMGCDPIVAAYASGLPADEVARSMQGKGRYRGFIKAVAYFQRVHRYLDIAKQIREIDAILERNKGINKDGDEVTMSSIDRVRHLDMKTKLVGEQTTLLPTADENQLGRAASYEETVGPNPKLFVDSITQFIFHAVKGRKSTGRVPASPI